MQSVPLRQLFKTAAITAPLIALMFVTPIFLLTSERHNYNFIVLLFGVSIAVFVAWSLNILAILKINKPWVLSWRRILLVASMMYVVSLIMFYLIKPELNIKTTTIEIIRFVNILAVNSIIYVLINLILSKENETKYALENSNLKLLNLEAEFKLLKDQINPHFLFNALSTAKALIKKDSKLAEEYIVRLSEFLRASINNNRKVVTLKEELDLCNEFIALNKIRFGEAIRFNYQINTDLEQSAVPYFAILSLIENAIKHNSFTIETPLFLEIKSNGDSLVLTNNKQTKFVMESSPKTGLKNLNDRYKLLGVKELEIKDEKDSFSVKIALIKK